MGLDGFLIVPFSSKRYCEISIIFFLKIRKGNNHSEEAETTLFFAFIFTIRFFIWWQRRAKMNNYEQRYRGNTKMTRSP